jgi:transglutaminase-like putative cysteine protease
MTFGSSQIRVGTFTLLAAFGALRWATLVAPAAAGRMLAAVVLAAAIAPIAVVTGRRTAVIAALAVVQVLVVLVAAGAPVRLLLPDAWGTLASGVGQGISALPGLNVPYRGLDEWTRTVLLACGAGLVVLAGWVALRPAARVPVAGAALLSAVYAVPVVESGPRAPFVSGAVFTVLLAAFLFGDRIGRRDLRMAAGLLLAATACGLLLAPRLDGARPLLNYEHIAAGLEAHGTTSFDWSHHYGPLHWPRDGSEMLRIKARTAAYWKAVSLERFDGVRWRQGTVVVGRGEARAPPGAPAAWHQTIQVVVRNLRSHQYVGAGTTEQVRLSRRGVEPSSPGTYVTGAGPLRRGDTYRADVYTPRPTARQLRTAGTDYPQAALDDLDVDLPSAVGGPQQVAGLDSARADVPALVTFPAFGTPGPPYALRGSGIVDRSGGRLLERSRYARVYALARKLAAGAGTPYDLVRAVERRVGRGAIYSEQPARHALPLDAFLFTDRRGYCQQFSGAMALLLRMGGVPARIAAGFAPGTFDGHRGEYVVRDVDAHSWVEAYFPGYGWVPFDPTPAIAPPRSQASADRHFSAATADTSDRGGGGPLGRPAEPRAPSPLAGGGRDGHGVVLLVVALLVAGLLAAGAVVLVRRGRVPAALVPELAERQGALFRSGRLPAPSVTLRHLEAVLDSDEGGAAYVRALREQRYGGRPAGPTPAQRRDLRRTLAAGLGAGGRLRAWWALPPRLGRRQRPYTGA